MPLPAILDVAETYLFADQDKMVASGLPEATIRHLVRLRDIYNYWLSYPQKKDRDIVAELKTRYGLGDTVAREDLKLIKTLLGDLQKVTKDYMRYRVTQMLTRAYEKADIANNTRVMVAAADKLAKYYALDKEDDRANVIDKIVRVTLKFTDDPEVIGLKRMPNVREKMKSLKDKYWSEATEEVDYEEIDAELEDIFKPLRPDYGSSENQAGIS